MIQFIDDHRSEYGVESICRVLPIAPSTYYAHRRIKHNPQLASPRAKKDKPDCEDIKRVWLDNRQVYGVRKVWHALRREGKVIARCTVARLMKMMIN